jgi:tRNA1(Val) A37 N6-methylase TrmN6
MEKLSQDAFLGGKLTLSQPVNGYRAGADPVFLAASVPAASGDTVLDLGCGVGTALFCLMARVPGLVATGVEINPSYANIARQNAADTGFGADIHKCDLTKLPDTVRNLSFDHVITNPPFFDRADGSAAVNEGREAARGETVDLTQWMDVCVRRLSPKGTLSVVQRSERLPALFAALDDRVGDIALLPLVARKGRPAKLVILQARKGAKGPFRLLPPFVLHKGKRHERDGDSYTDQAQDILRKGGALPL